MTIILYNDFKDLGTDWMKPNELFYYCYDFTCFQVIICYKVCQTYAMQWRLTIFVFINQWFIMNIRWISR